ncbi:unnamed protein product (macronuclear) [Paramecium tetraurelia]|uniref:RCK N-terminal domain-containing protein n=1 Tax=Paramecium tetraurelia TaxID=5888 RepID=A0CYF6_PARTE|nr:uncharacterized protein GSPATT00011423001 [Paramecium tetraurelia]CAK75823.1 unnamed protein product [Paramecium tetraurelia]|eukprot:XP_001443220.1 hypothetical protein (macronuclear) [Paramecium tetraurelia strain d4-2]
MVNSEDDTTTKKHEEGKTTFTLKMAKYLSTSGIGDYLDGINVLLSFLLTVLHLIDCSFWDQGGNQDVGEGQAIITIPELICYIYFLLDFVINFYLSENKLFFTFQTTSLVEYVSIFPSLLARLNIITGYKYIYMLRVLRFLLCYKLDKVLQRLSMEGIQLVQFRVFRLAYKPIVTVMSIIMINSSVLYVVEQDYSIVEYIYFMVVTISTVGFGDVYPTTIYGRFSIIVAILIMFLVLPTQVEMLTRVYSLRSQYARNKYISKKESEHLLLLGSSQVEGFKTFLNELYHTDHGMNDINTVILQPSAPTEEMTLQLKQPALQSKVIYLEGHPLQNKDLERCSSKDCNQHLREMITVNIIHAFAVKQFAKKQKSRKGARVCLQVLQPSSKDLYFNSLGGHETDQVICVDELKLYLLGKTCLCPGINTLISFLIQSSKPSYDITKYDKDKSEWIDDYLCGIVSGICWPDIQLSNLGFLTTQISSAIYKELNIILFALEVELESGTSVFVNPVEYLFEDYLHYGYVIASEMPNIDEIQQIKFPEYIQRNYCFPNQQRQQTNKNALQQEAEYLKEILSEGLKDDSSKHPAYYQVKPQTITTGLPKVGDQEKFENHFIVCGVVTDMKYLMMPLRARSLKNIQPIVILNQDLIPTEIQLQINKFPKVYFQQGSPLNTEDLKKACIQKASALVILQKSADQEDGLSNIVDADTIFIYKTVKLLNQNINIITELASISTISFLQISRNNYVQKYDWSVSEPFASGEIYISTMLDTLICQAFYNPFITSIFDQMILGSASVNKKHKKLYQANKLQQSNLFLINIPPKYQEKTFGELFEILLTEQKMIPIGLYRGEKVKNNNKPYVFLKPPMDVVVSCKDRLYVLSGKQPKEQENVVEDENNFGQAAAPQQYNIKSKLQGEEGRVDIEFSRELMKFNDKSQSFVNELKKINSRVFNQGLIHDCILQYVFRIRQKCTRFVKRRISQSKSNNLICYNNHQYIQKYMALI